MPGCRPLSGPASARRSQMASYRPPVASPARGEHRPSSWPTSSRNTARAYRMSPDAGGPAGAPDRPPGGRGPPAGRPPGHAEWRAPRTLRSLYPDFGRRPAGVAHPSLHPPHRAPGGLGALRPAALGRFVRRASASGSDCGELFTSPLGAWKFTITTPSCSRRPVGIREDGGQVVAERGARSRRRTARRDRSMERSMRACTGIALP